MNNSDEGLEAQITATYKSNKEAKSSFMGQVKALIRFWDNSVVPYVFDKNFGDFGREEE